MAAILIYILGFSITFCLSAASNVYIDPEGYILYCPCMGRFGNQADHFLGALGFSKGLNRTLVLPPWIEYRYGEPRSIQVPFDTYFKVEPLKEYHRVLTMEEFMKDIAPQIWTPDKRIAFCYTMRGESGGCNAKEGNPFGPFWDTYDVDFVGSEFYGPLHYDTYHHDMSTKWNEKYPPSEWPVLAFTGAPASFPVQIENRDLHKYLQWSSSIQDKARNFIKTVLPRGGFVGIHLRNGIDWVQVCKHVPQSPNLFSAPQCLGYRNEHGTLTNEICQPSTETILRQLKRVIRGMDDVKSVFVASDSNHMLKEIGNALKRMEISVHRLEPSDPHVDLAILGQANHFIGNCVSSFSAFTKRERDARGLPTSFWGFPAEKAAVKNDRDEL
ncbi:hypothetical protein R5R35_003548 [Gryllus longicercus]|uniref:GDP-fucose protein O-fucosyltransferase 1 n=1 Tax=Gryllus longicercus TaxID=2509291 RepID=A0AAN9V5S5_9ORTH